MVSRIRLTLLIFLIATGFAYLIFNLYNLQIKQGGYYTARAESQYKLAGFLEPHRGLIYFTNKAGDLVPVALNKSYPVIFAVPKEIEDADEAIEMMSPILDIQSDEARNEIRNSLKDKNSLYRLLSKKAAPEQVKKIKELKLSGIYVDEKDFRFYPFNELGSHLLGYVGPTKESDVPAGRYGMERQFDELLMGMPGTVSGDQINRPVQGEDLVLTIDQNIQGRAEDILQNLIKKYRAVGGTVIVQEPKTGNILALGSYPNFDPNNYSKAEISSFLNPAQQAVYEPGSVFKVISMASALDAKAVTPATTYYDSGHLTLNGKVIRNWDLKSHGNQTMTEVIEKSLNTGSAFAVSRLGGDKFYQYLKKFGFANITGIQLLDEVLGNIENIKQSKEINVATASFGQGISVTPISLINAVSAIANHGVLMRPNLLAGEKSRSSGRVISRQAADEITSMMVSAVKKAVIASIPNYQVAGKTGTAQVPNFQKGGYTDEVINTYIGFAPASDPQFTILIKIDKPAGAPLAGLTVVPAFRELAEFILNYYNISPDDLSS